jgi:BirA family biotin operon repressor/biotin-[acetyl-CoA-carboxylase] ligase
LNLFNYDQIKAKLNNYLNKKIVLKIFSSIDSTNDQAKNHVKRLKKINNKNNNKKTYVFASDFQEKGRGRRGHSWFSGGPDGLAVSFLFEVGDDIAKIPLITAAAALAVNETLEYFDLKNKIKWPNDILVADKKITGILSELVLDNSQKAFVIIGCGINLNNSNFETEINNLATSYYLEKKEKINKNLFLAILIDKMQNYLDNYLYRNREEIIKKWKEKLDLTGKTIDLTYKNENYTGKIEKILDNGDLLIDFENGPKKPVDSFNTSLDYKSLDKYNYCK